jgi:hypothetical protein
MDKLGHYKVSRLLRNYLPRIPKKKPPGRVPRFAF